MRNRVYLKAAATLFLKVLIFNGRDVQLGVYINWVFLFKEGLSFVMNWVFDDLLSVSYSPLTLPTNRGWLIYVDGVT